MDQNNNQSQSNDYTSPYGPLGDPYSNQAGEYSSMGQGTQPPGSGVDMTQGYQPPAQTPPGQGIAPQDYLTVQKSPSNMPLYIIGGVVVVLVVGALAGFFYISGRSSQAGNTVPNPVSPAPVAENVPTQSAPGLTVDTEESEESVADTEPDESEDIPEDRDVIQGIPGAPQEDQSEADTPVDITVTLSVSLAAEQDEPVTVGDTVRVVVGADSLDVPVTAFDILLSFDPAAFDIAEEDITVLDESFDTFLFYREHEDGLAHVTVSGVMPPDADLSSLQGDLLSFVFTSTSSGSHDFTVLESHLLETTKIVSEQSEALYPEGPETLTIEAVE